MGRIVQIKKNGKVKKAHGAAVKTLQEYGALSIYARVAALQQMVPLALIHSLDMIEDDVRRLAGERYKRNGLPGYDRWGSQRGSICLHNRRIPNRVCQRTERPAHGQGGPLEKHQSEVMGGDGALEHRTAVEQGQWLSPSNNAQGCFYSEKCNERWNRESERGSDCLMQSTKRR